MPIYEYRCKNGHTLEVLQRMSDDPLASCTTCDAPVQRVFHPVAVHFKGSGFYATDYGRKGENSQSKNESTSKSDSDSKGKSDSKPEKPTTESKSKASD
jgi:putative FmdB family regulatory protein